MNYYHGTSDALLIGAFLLPPNDTGIKREDWRKKHQDKVFLTSSYKSAEYYAKKACEVYGGAPVVYKCEPMGNLIHLKDIEWIADMALILLNDNDDQKIFQK